MLIKRGQVSIFVIIAIIIVAGIIGYFLLRERITIREVPANLKLVEDYFLSCVEDYSEQGIEILGSQAGYIYMPEFVPGSEYMPSSSQLNFLGSPVPYWYYVSGNNIIREQVPSKTEIEEQLEKYLEENLDCDFSEFRGRGFEIDFSDFKADVSISDISTDVAVSGNLDISFEGESVRISNHELKVNTKLGKLYSQAIKIYNYEKEKVFLENYAVDVLRAYVPVDGVELSCSPKIWLKSEIDNELKQALEANMQAIRFGSEKGYFNQNLNIGEDVNILYDRNWPTRIEVWDSNNGVMTAEPVGNQQGLGILGFCYVPYHFVYDVVYPVLIQIYDVNEMFQFPVAVIIDKNKAREALPVYSILNPEPELCKYRNTKVTVYTYNNELDAVEADIDFECLGQRCNIGRTEIKEGDAVLDAEFPQCINGFVSASAEGYAGKRYQYSSNSEGIVNILLDKLYELDVELMVNNGVTSDRAIITFVSENNVQTVAWPEQKSVKLSEGLYNISVYVYRDSKIFIPGIKQQICNTVPKSGLLGLFGQKEEKCFDVDLPSQELTDVISGGGKTEEYIVESQLQNKKIKINVMGLPVPTSLEQLQDSYNLLEVKPAYIEFE